MDRDELKIPTGENARWLAREMPNAPTVSPAWQPLRAPGFTAAPADDARQVCPLLEGWTRRTLPSVYEDFDGSGTYVNTIEGRVRHPLPRSEGDGDWTVGRALPDPWRADRNFHHAWYLLRIELDSPDPDATYWLRFDAVGHACTLFVNSQEAGRHLGGYTPFEFEIGPHLQPGSNFLAVRVQDDTAVFDPKANRAVCQLDGGNGMYNAHHAGIRGGIYLERRPPLHVARIRVRTSTTSGQLTTETWFRGGKGTLSQTVVEWPAGQEPMLILPDQPIPAGDGEPKRIENAIDWPDAKRWSPEHPHLYVLRTTLRQGDRSETVETRFGFREFGIKGKQFLLNGAPIRLFGDGSHPRHLMSTVPDKARDFGREALLFLKREFHYNACRLHGSVHPGWATEAADEAGVLIINQSGLRHHRSEANERGGEEFLRHIEREFEEWYWRDVNSPSVVIWDVENELIRGKRTPRREAWVLRLDTFIRRHDPEAIIEHSGAGWYHADQQILHVHMQEQYTRIMRQWRERECIPLVLGEFWMGGRGETRLPNSREYGDREDWHREEARLFREKILEMRHYGVSGILSHRLTHWPLHKLQPLTFPEDAADAETRRFQWRFPAIGGFGGRGLAPVVAFAWPRGSAVVEGETFEREIVICNDREEAADLRVACDYAGTREAWTLQLGPGEQRRIRKAFTARAGTQWLVVDVRDADGKLLEQDRLALHAIPAERVSLPPLKRQIVVVPRADAATAAALRERGVPYSVSETLPENPEQALVLAAPDLPDDALGRTPRRVKEWLSAGGRLLVLPQTRAPRWLPLGLPFWSAVRSSVPEFDRGGWAPTNKDLIYTREAPVYAGGHPAFEGLAPSDFNEWNANDGRIGDDAFIRPHAIYMEAGGPYRVLLGATRRENASLVEMCTGRGTAIFCQAQILENRACPAARVLFFNLLRYLDGPGWAVETIPVGLLGDLSAQRVADLTGLPSDRLVRVDDAQEAPALVLAGDRADPDRMRELARAGATVLVLSREASARLPGFSVEFDEQDFASGTRYGAEDHPLFHGMASGSFLPLEHTPARGCLAAIPRGARVLMGGHRGGHSPLENVWSLDIGFYGPETRDPCGPIAAACTEGQGEIIATTLEPWALRKESHRQLLTTLLANAGVALPTALGARASATVKWTEPLLFDGVLDDWTNDMDDITFSVHSHADPIAITSTARVEGPAASDLDYSALLYFLHDAEHLYIGGFIISAADPGRIDLELGEHALCLEPGEARLSLDGKPAQAKHLAFGRQAAAEIVDSRLLNLAVIHPRSGKAEPRNETPGVTFECAVPWIDLGRNHPPEALSTRIRLARNDGVVLALPGPSEPQPLTLTFDSTRRIAE